MWVEANPSVAPFSPLVGLSVGVSLDLVGRDLGRSDWTESRNSGVEVYLRRFWRFSKGTSQLGRSTFVRPIWEKKEVGSKGHFSAQTILGLDECKQALACKNGLGLLGIGTNLVGQQASEDGMSSSGLGQSNQNTLEQINPVLNLLSMRECDGCGFQPPIDLPRSLSQQPLGHAGLTSPDCRQANDARSMDGSPSLGSQWSKAELGDCRQADSAGKEDDPPQPEEDSVWVLSRVFKVSQYLGVSFEGLEAFNLFSAIKESWRRGAPLGQ
ncbi:hypothetical protein LOK49_LG05G02891 [Camellia lanceoleosa]|uniref:Uncharacterized protein n=1 Tax=Camellia lanceoleosa TaxID=1840588 RepID=A0ACC0HTA2_9ERIC|nr:hypothetical protein LOK49_LG05G02891 [Camellia lanceoleosa]